MDESDAESSTRAGRACLIVITGKPVVMSRRRAGAWLAEVLRRDALPFHEFATWSDIAGALVQGGT